MREIFRQLLRRREGSSVQARMLQQEVTGIHLIYGQNGQTNQKNCEIKMKDQKRDIKSNICREN